jgi:hypothetical protein
MNLPADNSPQAYAMRQARAMSNLQLATAIEANHIGHARKAFVAEAARRLRWVDVYESHCEEVMPTT